MRITTLIENTVSRPDLACEHGLSLYLEVGEKRILFDAGQTSAFADNACKLDVDLSEVNLCVLSHGHYDHGGGLGRFLEINRHAPIFLSRHALEAHFHGPEKDIGLDKALAASNRLVFVDGETSIAPNMTLHTTIPCPHGIAPQGLQVMENGALHPEDFRHEIYLRIVENGRTMLLSGCSHRGILNIAEHFAPDVFIGGFHLAKVTESSVLSGIAEGLQHLPSRYYTGHCTGETAFLALRERLGDRLQSLSTGSVHII